MDREPVTALWQPPVTTEQLPRPYTQMQEMIRRPPGCSLYLNEATQTVSGDRWTEVNTNVSSLLSKDYEPAHLSSSGSRA